MGRKLVKAALIVGGVVLGSFALLVALGLVLMAAGYKPAQAPAPKPAAATSAASPPPPVVITKTVVVPPPPPVVRTVTAPPPPPVTTTVTVPAPPPPPTATSANQPQDTQPPNATPPAPAEAPSSPAGGNSGHSHVRVCVGHHVHVCS